MERQKHGFLFEEKISKKYGITLNSDYTGKWDGYFDKIPVSIKHIKKGNAIDLGDIFRQASILEPFYLIVGFYSENNSDEIYLLKFEENEWHKFFMERDFFEPIFRNALDSVSNDPSDDNKWKNKMALCKNLWKANTPNIVKPNGKRDHKKQKRWQCSISNKLFFTKVLPYYQIKEEELK